MSAEPALPRDVPASPAWPPPWAKRIRDFASQVVPQNFTGKITLNFNEGGDGKINIESWTK